MSLVGTQLYDPSGNYIASSGVVWRELETPNRKLWNDVTGYATALTEDKDDGTITYNGSWVFTGNLGPVLQVADESSSSTKSTWDGKWYLYNNERYWTDGTYYLWYTGAKWIISKRLGSCIYEEWADTDDDGTADAYIGDDWYDLPDGTPEGFYRPRGSNRGSVADDSGFVEGDYLDGAGKAVNFKLDGYRILDGEGEKSNVPPAGEYMKFDREATWNDTDDVMEATINEDDTDTIIIGVPAFEDINNTSDKYIRSVEKDSMGNYTYGDIYYYSGTYGDGWAIGTPGTGTWWEGEGEPDIDSDKTFTEYELDSDGNKVATGSTDKVISFDEYRMGDNTEGIYYGSIGLWL